MSHPAGQVAAQTQGIPVTTITSQAGLEKWISPVTALIVGAKEHEITSKALCYERLAAFEFE